MWQGPTPQPGVMDIELGAGGSAQVAGVDNVIKLSSNENPWGPSPMALEAPARAEVAEEAGSNVPAVMVATAMISRG